MSMISISGFCTNSRQLSVEFVNPNLSAAAFAACLLISAKVWSFNFAGILNTCWAVAKPKTCAFPMKPEPIRPIERMGL